MTDFDRLRHILIVEDDAVTRTRIRAYFENEGFRVSESENGAGVIQTLTHDPVDVVLLDVNLPGTDGFKLARELSEKTAVKIILVTARTDDVDRVVGLEIGADDYVTKPFNPRELLARVKNLIRRSSAEPPAKAQPVQYAFGGWTLDTSRRCLVDADGRQVVLTRGEFELLSAFLEHPGEVLSRERLLSRVTHRVWSPGDRTVDVLVRRLRQKLGTRAGEPCAIRTVHGEGYLFACEVD